MIKTFIVDKTDVNMRIDRLLRSKLGKIPQSLIEKSLRNGKIKLNKKIVVSTINQYSRTFSSFIGWCRNIRVKTFIITHWKLRL